MLTGLEEWGLKCVGARSGMLKIVVLLLCIME